MKVAHWTLTNGSGMHRTAEAISNAERSLGIDSTLVTPGGSLESYDSIRDADIHIAHTHVSDTFLRSLSRPYKLIWTAHGTPEHSFQTSVEAGQTTAYGFGDSWMLAQHWLRTADAIVTFWPRHQYIWKSLCDKGTQVHCLPFGIDKTFWKPVPNSPRFAGSPSVFSGENPHYIKWPLDLLIAWPQIAAEVSGTPCLHLTYLTQNLHRWFFPLVNRNGSSYSSYIMTFPLVAESLRGAMSGIDFFVGLVQKGDFNTLSHQANACGMKTISYHGNPHSDFWIHEGDQRSIATELVNILNGVTKPRDKSPIPDVIDTAKAYSELYASLS